jgi:hypothetical protein
MNPAGLRVCGVRRCKRDPRQKSEAERGGVGTSRLAKTLGVLALLIPRIPFKVKEFVYFGFGITLISASIAYFPVIPRRIRSQVIALVSNF